MTPARDPGAARTQRLALTAGAAALSAWALDTAGVTVALPVMQTDLGITITAAQWVLNLAFLALAGLVTLGGWLGDRKGRVVMFRAGLLVFIGGSVVAVAAGLAESYPLLLAARFAAGAGAAMFVPAGTALLIDVYPPEQRGAATGKAFAITMLVTTVGPMLAGAIVQGIGWPWVFVPGLLLAVVALGALARISLPAPRRDPTSRASTSWVPSCCSWRSRPSSTASCRRGRMASPRRPSWGPSGSGSCWAGRGSGGSCARRRRCSTRGWCATRRAARARRLVHALPALDPGRRVHGPLRPGGPGLLAHGGRAWRWCRAWSRRSCSRVPRASCSTGWASGRPWSWRSAALAASAALYARGLRPGELPRPRRRASSWAAWASRSAT